MLHMGTSREIQRTVNRLYQRTAWRERLRRQLVQVQSDIDGCVAHLEQLNVDPDDIGRLRAQAEQAAQESAGDDQATG